MFPVFFAFFPLSLITRHHFLFKDIDGKPDIAHVVSLCVIAATCVVFSTDLTCAFIKRLYW